MKYLNLRYQCFLGTFIGIAVAINSINSYVQFMTDQGFFVFNWIEDQKIINSQQVAGWDFFQFYRFYLQPFVRGEFNLNTFSSSQLLKIQPPFMVVMLSPFGLLSYPRAYYFHVICLTLANLSCLFCFARLSSQLVLFRFGRLDFDIEISHYWRLADLLLIIVAVLHFLSWGFAYSIEKGNYDAYPMLLIVIGLALMIYKPSWVWLQVFVFSMATHLKIYPAIMFLLLLWQHRQKAILPLIVINLAMALGLGWENFTIWISAVIEEMRSVSTDWSGSSSTGSYIRYMLAEFMPFWASVFNTSKEHIASI